MRRFSSTHNLILLVLILLSFTGYSQTKETRIFNDSIVKISELSTNSIHSDFGPFAIKDTLYFTTFNDKLNDKTDWTLKNREFYDLYKANLDKYGNVIGERQPLVEFITRYNDGPVSWCEKTEELFITQNYLIEAPKHKPFQKTVNRLRIVIAKRINGKWANITDFPYNNPEYSVGHPAVTQTGDTLVFSTDRPGGFGETDLYMSVRKNGKWGLPVNMGSQINTSGKEEFAFITDKNFNGGQYLIFASKGRFGKGGFDLYYTKFPSDFSEIGHFDSPLNTEFDDFAMTIPPDAEYGYLTSNRPGTGNDDIYKFTFKRFPKTQDKCRQLYVYDKSSLRPIPGVRITSCDNQLYMTDRAGLIPCLPCIGNECKVIASTFGYPEKSKILSECKMAKNGIVSDTIWMNLIVNEKIILNNIYYDFDKSDILPDAALELDQLVALMKENPEMRVELSSHTDVRGTELYNLKLSQRRAQSAVDYIISKGIERYRIFGTGYGKTQLINPGYDYQKLSPQQNRENRRTEIFIPGFLRGNPVKQEKGDYSLNISPYQSVATSGVGTKIIVKQEANSVVSIENPTKYYLIIGSFKGIVNSTKVANELKLKGYEAILLHDDKFFRIALEYDNLNNAKTARDILKVKYHDAWIQNGKEK
jgi:outer membrane protein OmpA-like peptidoglycan-associated protein